MPPESPLDPLEQRLPEHARDLKLNLGALASSTALTPAPGVDDRDRLRVHDAPPPAGRRDRNSGGAEYRHMPARLRMQIIANPGIEKLDFELACLAASAITGCEACVRSHERAVRERGGTKKMVQDAVRIAAVLHGVAIALGA